MSTTEDLIPGLPEEIARECLVRVPHDLFSAVGSVCKSWKNELNSPQFHRIRKDQKLTRSVVAYVQAVPAAATAGPARKYCTATYRLSVFDLSAATWQTLPPIPGESGLPLFCQVAAVGTNLVVVGGWDPTTWAPCDAVHVFDFLSNTWRRGARMPGPRRSFFACAAGNGRVFVAGGHDGEKNALASAMAYDVAGDEWVQLPEMAVCRDECKGVFVNGRFVVVGGYTTERQGQFCSSAESFECATWRWGPVEEDVVEEGTCPRTCVADGDEVYMVRGGHVAVMADGRWKDVAEVPEDATVGLQLVVAGTGKIVVTGTGRDGGAHVGYVMELGKNGKLRRIEMPEEYSGHVQAACCLEI